MRSYYTHTGNNCLVPRRHLYHISSSKNTRYNDNISSKNFNESIPFEEVNPDHFRHSNFRFINIHTIENKLTRFQIYPETELACNYTKPLYKTQNSEILVEYEDGFDMNTGK